MPLLLDLTDESSIEIAVDEISDSATSATLLSGVILAASPPPVAVPFGQISVAEMELQWRANVLGPQILVSSLVRRVFRRSKQGFVIGVLSDAMGREGEPADMSMGAYVIGKYGLAGVLALAAHDYPWLHVRSVRPGFTDTGMLRAFDERFVEQLKTRGAVRPPCAVAADIMATLPSFERVGS
jgi:3-oxoacyl-[acyl-carrier protein] reductase